MTIATSSGTSSLEKFALNLLPTLPSDPKFHREGNVFSIQRLLSPCKKLTKLSSHLLGDIGSISGDLNGGHECLKSSAFEFICTFLGRGDQVN